MNDDEHHRDIGEAVDNLNQAHADRGCLKVRLAKSKGQMEAMVHLLGSERPAVADGKSYATERLRAGRTNTQIVGSYAVR